MIHHVPLANPPPNFRVPENLQARFGYDADKRALVYRGPMFKATFDRLRDISPDYDYQRALEDLFRLATPAAPTRRANRARLVAILGVAALLALIALITAILLIRP